MFRREKRQKARGNISSKHLNNENKEKVFQLKTVAHASFLINFHYAPFIEQFPSSESNLFKCEREKGPITSRRNAANHFLKATT